MRTDTPVVLVADDERDLADLYAAWLAAAYHVKTAYGGQPALEMIDEDVDVVLLDRNMPDLSGDEVLANIRDRGLACRVAIVTAVAPDFDILELGFDDYLTKPVRKENLVEAVERLLRRREYDTTLQEYYRLAVKRARLESEKGLPLRNHPKYQELLSEMEDLEAELDLLTREFEAEDFDAQFLQTGRE